MITLKLHFIFFFVCVSCDKYPWKPISARERKTDTQTVLVKNHDGHGKLKLCHTQINYEVVFQNYDVLVY